MQSVPQAAGLSYQEQYHDSRIGTAQNVDLNSQIVRSGPALPFLYRDDFGGLLGLIESYETKVDNTKLGAFHRLVLAYGLCHTDMMLAEAVAASDMAWEQWLNQRVIEDYDELDVYMSCIYHIIQELGRRLLGGDEWDIQESPSLVPLGQLRRHLLDGRRYKELIFVFQVQRSVCTAQEMVSSLQESLKTFERTLNIQGKIQSTETQNLEAWIRVLLADNLGAPNQTGVCEEHLQYANQVFQKNENRAGCLWVEFYLATRKTDDSLDYVEHLENLATQFTDMRDFKGFLKSKIAIADCHQKHQRHIEYHSTVMAAFQTSIMPTQKFEPRRQNGGSALFFWQFYMARMPHDMEDFRFIGTALALGEIFFSLHPRCSIPQLQYALASDLSRLYGERIGDQLKELKWATVALTQAKATHIQEMIIDAQKSLDILLAGRNVRPAADPYGFHLSGWREAKKRDLEIEFDEAGKELRWGDQFAFANELMMMQLSDEIQIGAKISGEPWASRTKEVLQQLPDDDTRKDRDLLMRANIAGATFESGDAEGAATLIYQLSEERPPTDLSLRLKIPFMLGRVRLQTYRETQDQRHWKESYRLFTSVVHAAIKENRVDMAACCHCIMAELWRVGGGGGMSWASQALSHIDEAERLWNAERDGIWNLGGLDGLLTRFSLRGRNEGGPIDVFAIAYQACFGIDDYTQAWRWAQKAKARGFVDGLSTGGESRTPNLHHAKMSRDLVTPDYPQMIDTSLSWIYGLGLEEQEVVVCLDWITAGETIFLISVRVGGPPLMHKLDISLSTVNQWYSDLQNTKDDLRDASAYETLSELAALCEPLKSPLVSKPGEVLVLCPTKVISKIPLHALEVDGDVLLARNPVVYTYALPVLQQCLSRFQQRHESAAAQPMRLFGNPTGDTPGGERSVKSLASAMSAQNFVRHNASKMQYITACQSSKLIHYHGHVVVTDTPQDHTMIFGDSVLGLADVFSLNLQKYSPFISIVGCGSGTEISHKGDEPLGLVSSFIYAGASSVLATLWPISDSLSGEPFASEFYREFAPPAGQVSWNTSKRRVNLARALQKAALGIKNQAKTQAPYYWAGYVLHGQWFFELGR